VLIECGDSLDSINATSSAIVKYVSQRAGIGINAGRIRALGSPIRGGEAFHTGCIPFYKHFQTAVKSCSQGGVRGGAATLFYPMWHLEVESLLVLKNNRGTDANRVRHMDYGVQINKLMYTRLLKGGDITLFSPSDVPGLYDAFFADQDEFERLYTQYEQDDSIRKQRIKAVELFSLMMQERASTGRIYIQNVDHCNTHSPFDPVVAPVRQSNLCLEIALPTKPLEDVNDENGEIALCTLSAFNLGAIDSLDELEELAVLAVVRWMRCWIIRITRSRRQTRRNGPSYAGYRRDQLRLLSGEAWQTLLRRQRQQPDAQNVRSDSVLPAESLNELAIEQGACPWFNETTYAQGILPIDTYKKDLDASSANPCTTTGSASRVH
jgi:ribonucleoside-diphosphate reductase alpha chain